MSSRPIFNLEKVLASINFKEDDVVVTPEPPMVQGPIEGQVLYANGAFPGKQRPRDLDSSSVGSDSTISSEDVPLTADLLTPTVRDKQFGTCFSFRGYNSDGETDIGNDNQDDRRRRIQNSNQQVGGQQKRRKNGLPFKLPASSESLLEYDRTADGIDVYQERERAARRLVRQKKTKKRRCGEEEDEEDERKVRRRGASFH